MRWLIFLIGVVYLEYAESYKRSIPPHYVPHGPHGPHAGPHGPHVPHIGSLPNRHTHIHHPYSKRHFNVNRDHLRGPPFPPKPHYHNHGNHVHHTHAQSTHLKPYSFAGGHSAVQHGSPYQQGLSLPAPIPYPNPNFLQQHTAYQAPGVQQLVAVAPSPTPKPTFASPSVYIPPAATYLPAYLKDDDKGPIHTIPAPNLSPADKPAGFDEFMLKNSIQHSNLIINNYRNKPSLHHYQVNEEASLAKGALFAPDPDPSVPTLKVPPTTDPHSIPTNGQVPLDLYLQQQAEKQQLLQEQALEQQHLEQQSLQQHALQEQQSLQQHALQEQQVLHQQILQQQGVQQTEQDENALTAQDLFNLMNYQPNVIPESQLQQHILQPNVQFYTNPLYLQHSQFMNPQYQNFNYDERTQQSAYGSDSFPVQSLSNYFGNPEDSNLLDVVNTNEISKKLDQRDTKKTNEKYQQVDNISYTSLSSKRVAEALASLSAAGALNNGEQILNEEHNNDEIMKQEENNNSKLYESSFPTESQESQVQSRKLDPDTEASNYNLIKSEKLADLNVNLENQAQNANRVRPKRY